MLISSPHLLKLWLRTVGRKPMGSAHLGGHGALAGLTSFPPECAAGILEWNSGQRDAGAPPDIRCAASTQGVEWSVCRPNDEREI